MDMCDTIAVVPFPLDKRRLYDNYLGQWKDNCVRRDDYQRYIMLLDRNIPVSKKTFKTAP